MSTVKSSLPFSSPSFFSLLIDDISKMSEPEQKLLWLELNKKKLSSLAQILDANVTSHNLSSNDIDKLINEAKRYGKAKKG